MPQLNINESEILGTTLSLLIISPLTTLSFKIYALSPSDILLQSCVHFLNQKCAQ